MHRLRILALAIGLACFGVGSRAESARISKVLPQYLDREGRVSLSPSLFERDAYQAQLRARPDHRAGLRLAVEWSAKDATHTHLILRLELVTAQSTPQRPLVLERPVRAKTAWRHWTRLSLSGQAFRDAGDLIAWRATLWAGNRLLAEQRSFLW